MQARGCAMRATFGQRRPTLRPHRACGRGTAFAILGTTLLVEHRRRMYSAERTSRGRRGERVGGGDLESPDTPRAHALESPRNTPGKTRGIHLVREVTSSVARCRPRPQRRAGRLRIGVREREEDPRPRHPSAAPRESGCADGGPITVRALPASASVPLRVVPSSQRSRPSPLSHRCGGVTMPWRSTKRCPSLRRAAEVARSRCSGARARDDDAQVAQLALHDGRGVAQAREHDPAVPCWSS